MRWSAPRGGLSPRLALEKLIHGAPRDAVALGEFGGACSLLRVYPADLAGRCHVQLVPRHYYYFFCHSLGYRVLSKRRPGCCEYLVFYPGDAENKPRFQA
jgi:hypothetical protein